MSLPKDTRRKIIRYKNLGYSNIKIAKMVECNKSTVGRFIKKYDKTKSFDDIPKKGAPSKISEREKRIIERKEFNSKKEIQDFLENNFQTKVSLRTLDKYFTSNRDKKIIRKK